MAEDTVVDLTKNNDDTGLKIPLRRYYLCIMCHYLQSLSFKFSHAHHPIIGAKPHNTTKNDGLKIPLRRYYLFVTTFSLSHYLQSLSFKFSHTHHPIIGAKPNNTTKNDDYTGLKIYTELKIPLRRYYLCIMCHYLQSLSFKFSHAHHPIIGAKPHNTTKNDGLKIPLRRYYLFVTTFSLSHYLQSLSFKFSHTHHPIIGAKPNNTTKNDDYTGLKISLRRYYLFVTTSSLSHSTFHTHTPSHYRCETVSARSDRPHHYDRSLEKYITF